MMKSEKLCILLVAVLTAIALAAGPVYADARKGGGEVGFDFGGTQFDDKLDRSGAPRVDFRIGYQASRLFQIEGQLGVADRKDLTMGTGFANLVFNFPTSDRTVPYFLVGGGVAYLDLDTTDDTAPAAQFAGGVRAYGEEGRMGIRLELGAMWEDTFETGKTHINFVVGFTFDLGKRHMHRAPKRRMGGFDQSY